MRPLALICCLTFSCVAPAAFAQIAVDGITASVSRTIAIVPDEASVAMLVTTDAAVTRQQVAEAVQSAGFSTATLVAMVAGQADYQYPPQEGTVVSYQFSFVAAATDLKDINQKLEAFRQAKPEIIQAIRYQTFLKASEAAVDEARQRIVPQLLSEARKRASVLAAATGLKLGAIQAVTDNAYSPGVSTPWFNSSSYILSNGNDAGGPQVTFSMNVKFAAN